MKTNLPATEGLLNAESTLATIWPDPSSRPSIRWLRDQQAKRTLPFVKCGRLVFFDVAKVKQALAKKFTVESV